MSNNQNKPGGQQQPQHGQQNDKNPRPQGSQQDDQHKQHGKQADKTQH